MRKQLSLLLCLLITASFSGCSRDTSTTRDIANQTTGVADVIASMASEGETTYPDDFPADGETVRVIGVFDAYEEEGNKYLTLRNAVLEPVPED